MANQVVSAFGREWSTENIAGSVGAGWKTILEKLVPDLFDLGWDGVLLQVKEKFGGLRFYVGASSEEVERRIKQAEDESYRTCEDCGAPGKVRSVGWIKTRCDACHGKKV